MCLITSKIMFIHMKTTPWTALVISNHFRLLVNKKPDFILSLAPTDAHPSNKPSSSYSERPTTNVYTIPKQFQFSCKQYSRRAVEQEICIYVSVIKWFRVKKMRLKCGYFGKATKREVSHCSDLSNSFRGLTSGRPNTQGYTTIGQLLFCVMLLVAKRMG